MFSANPELMAETRINYTYVVPLNQEAVFSGIFIGVLVALLAELIFLGIARLFRGSPQPARRY